MTNEMKYWLVTGALAGLVVGQLGQLLAQTKIAPGQLKAPRFVALACIAPGTANANCAGLYYIDAVTQAGTEIRIIGAAPTAPIDPAAWSPVP
jgi:hypothetical protein